MKRKIILLVALMIILSFTGCKKETCSKIGCEKEVYKEGLCELDWQAEFNMSIIETQLEIEFLESLLENQSY